MNRITVVNKNRFLTILQDRSRPLITVSNHRSNMDDPLIWCLFTWPEFFSNVSRFRYTLAANDICFTKSWHSWFFSLGKCIPVVRGAGVHQEGVDFCIDKLAKNGWIHIFPEGKVTLEPVRIKWGVARMIMDSPNPPIVLPIWIQRMAEVWPQSKPYYPRLGKHVTITIGKELDMKEYMSSFHSDSEIAKRKALADFVQEKLYDLGSQITQRKS
ncbi:unnamed protein product [Thelazia callipaeda]|uniref:Tafazzin family protein n=1 Tax=Thelazia callipaeda TaxID=103827 RepID=A0A0N5D0N3_THECL|nr:unnamed protein product [Thelazia callipaeda]